MFGALLPLLGLVGRVAGSAGQGASDQRLNENQQRLQAAQMANSDALARGQMQSNYNLQGANLDLNRRQFQQNEPNVQARQALIGSLLNRIQPAQLSGLSPRVQQSMPHMTSILDAIGPEARQAGSMLAQRGTSGLQSGPSQFAPLPALNLPPAQQAALQKSGLLEKILGGAGLVGSTLGAFGGFESSAGRPDQYASRLPGLDEDI